MKVMSRAALLISALTACIYSGSIAANDWLRSIPDFELSDQNGITHSLESFSDRDFIVLYVQGVGCPIARIATPSYIDVRAEFS